MKVDESKLNQLLHTMVVELGAAVNSVLVLIGDRLGLYRALSRAGNISAEELAGRTETNRRYIEEWLAAQAASGFVQYDSQSETFSMSPEQTAVFADEDSPVLMTGGFYSVASVFADEGAITEAFRTGNGIGWGEHHNCLFCGVEKFFRPSYKGSLVSSWIPSIDGLEEKLKAGAIVADVGCGHGASTLIMAEAFPNSEFRGFDFHEPSIAHANRLAAKSGLANIRFEVADAREFPGMGYDFVTLFDCLHDMGDPAGVSRHIHGVLKPDGTCMVVEPFAHDRLEENLNPVGRVYYGFSATVCTPTSLSQDVGLALGAQAGEQRLREVITAGGFTRFRRAAETPFNLILEARP